MRTRSLTIPLLLITSLACGPKPGEKKVRPLPINKPVDVTQPVASAPVVATAPVASAPVSTPTSTPSDSIVLDLPDLSTYTSKGTELTDPQAFAYHFEAGKTISYRVAIRWKLKGLNLPLGDFSGAFVTELNLAIKSVDAAGNAEVETTYGRIQAEFDAILLGGKKSFDSKAPGAAPDPLLAPFGKMDGKTFTMKLSKEGKITELVGQDKILEDALTDPSFPEDLKQQIKAAIGEQGLSQLLGQGFLAFPVPPMKKGDTFKATGSPLTIPGLGQIDTQEDVKLEGVRDIDGKKLGLFSMSIFALIDPQGGPSTTKLPGLRLAGEATPTIGEGFFVFDLARGLPSSAALPIPLDLKISLLKPDGTPTTPQPINVIGDVSLSAQLIE